MIFLEFIHKSVLLNESVEQLVCNPGGIYVDGTAGGGGHSSAILEKLDSGSLISIDQDPDAVQHLCEKFNVEKESLFRDINIFKADQTDKRNNSIVIVESNFSKMDKLITKLDIEAVDGVILDLGVSSYQLDTQERGFSYHKEAYLDMRMSKTGVSAYELVNGLSFDELSNIIYKYGEEKYSRSIASAIIKRRDIAPIKTTEELAEIIKESVPISIRKKGHPARKTFQALRIAVNDELGVLEKGLQAAFSILKPGGRLAVITFHSIEDRIVKQAMSKWCIGCTCPSDFPICICGNKPKARLVNKKPIIASQDELNENSRSRSAKLRICEKII